MGEYTLNFIYFPSLVCRARGGSLGGFISALLHLLGILWKMKLFACHFSILSLSLKMWAPSPAEFTRTNQIWATWPFWDSARWICWLRKGNTLSDRMLSSSGSSWDAIRICPQFCGDLRITKMPSRLRACPRLWKKESQKFAGVQQVISRIITGFVTIQFWNKHKDLTKILIPKWSQKHQQGQSWVGSSFLVPLACAKGLYIGGVGQSGAVHTLVAAPPQDV